MAYRHKMHRKHGGKVKSEPSHEAEVEHEAGLKHGGKVRGGAAMHRLDRKVRGGRAKGC